MSQGQKVIRLATVGDGSVMIGVRVWGGYDFLTIKGDKLK